LGFPTDGFRRKKNALFFRLFGPRGAENQNPQLVFCGSGGGGGKEGESRENRAQESGECLANMYMDARIK